MRRLAHVAGVTEGVPSRLRPYRQPVRFVSHRQRPDLSSVRADPINDIIKSAGHPENAPIGADVAHIGAAAARNGPFRLNGARSEIDHAYAARSVRMPMHSVCATVGDIELQPIAGDRQTMSADAGRDEAFERHCFTVQEVDAIRHHIGDVKHRSVRRNPDVLRHAPGWQREGADHASVWEVDLDQAVRELAGEYRKAPIGREISVVDAMAAGGRNRILQLHCVRVAKIEASQSLVHDDARSAVRREIHIVGVQHV